jgi:hypothetical protein
VSREPDDAPAPQQGEAFLSRWSRRKEEVRQAPAVPEKKVDDDKSPLPQLPPLEELTADSDYRAFFHPKVGEDVRRAALKKLFSDPRFNVMDGLDVYIDDYSKTEPIPPEMLAGLRQAQNILRWAKEDEEARAREQARLAAAAPVALEPPADAAAPAASIPDAAPAATPAETKPPQT